jgi:hypothetical protein
MQLHLRNLNGQTDREQQEMPNKSTVSERMKLYLNVEEVCMSSNVGVVPFPGLG